MTELPEQKSPWEIVSTQRILDTHYLKIRSEHVKLPNGAIIPDYYIIENRGWVGVLPFTDDGRFLINRQYKHGIGEEVLEFPAGMIEEGEEPLETAHRELMEETGYSVVSDEMEFLAQMVANPTGAQARIWWYLGHNARKTGVQNFDPGEDIYSFLVTPTELLALIHSGQFNIPGHIAAAYMAFERLGLLKTQF